MGSDAAVADAGETLVALLRDRMADLLAPETIALASPGDRGGDAAPRLTLFLYRVEENEHLGAASPEAVGTDRVAAAPLALDLHYLLTAHPTDTEDRSARSRDQQTILGRAMVTLRENAVVSGSDLRGSLAGDGPLRVTHVPGATAEALDVWSSFEGTPYQPSVAYVVGPVRLASGRSEPVSRVLERHVGARETGRTSGPDAGDGRSDERGANEEDGEDGEDGEDDAAA